MSYIRPSVLVYQDLLNAGGVLNSTPDLEACIIGPAYNKLEYIPSSLASKISTAAMSTSVTTGTGLAGVSAIMVVSTGGFNVGDSILILGAGLSGVTLQANITDITGNMIGLDTPIVTPVVDTTVTKTGAISSVTSTNTFTISGAKPGQVVDSDSVKVWVDNARIQTLITGGYGYLGGLTNNVITISSPFTVPTAGVTSGATSLTLAKPLGFVIGDEFTLVGAGTAGATFTGKIVNKVGAVITFTPATVTTVTNTAVITKVSPVNLNSTTNTLRAEPGDEVVVSYLNNLGNESSFASSVSTLVTSSGQNGTITQVTLTDNIPTDAFYQTVGTSANGNIVITSVGDTSGVSVGSHVVVKGAGVAGADLFARVASFVVDTSITLDTAASTVVAGAVIIVSNDELAISVEKMYSDQLLLPTKPISGGSNYDLSDVSTSNEITISAHPEVTYGPLLSGSVYFGYRALRADLAGQILTINDIADLEGQLGDLSDENPLGLGCQMALANTVTQIKAIAVDTDDLAGYQQAFEAAEGARVYALVPLTQNIDILTALQAHVVQMSTPENHSWRVAIVNTAIPTVQTIGQFSASFLNTNSGNNTVTLVGDSYVLTASNATFMSDGVVPGDIVHYADTLHQVVSVVSNQQLVITATTTATAVEYYISRAMTKAASAAAVAATSENFGSNRVWHVQPDTVGISINGAVKYLPGYYLCCGLAGMVAGFPAQQGFTNIGVAGISDLKNSNFHFSKSSINAMAESGTDVFVQDVQGGIPYCLHELTTDVTVLEYREQLIVKNWDFLSYFYYDKLKGFIGSWNITPDTINVIKQTLVASSELIKSKRLPKIGSPLISYNITSLEQDAFNKDNLNVSMAISIVYPLNYLNLHLVI